MVPKISGKTTTTNITEKGKIGNATAPKNSLKSKGFVSSSESGTIVTVKKEEKNQTKKTDSCAW